MSKSLKNFITIEQYFEDCCSVAGETNNLSEAKVKKCIENAADDFRLFCLQYKYSSSLHFSKDRIVEASSYRHRIHNFFQYSGGIIDLAYSMRSRNDQLQLTRPCSRSIALTQSIVACKESITAALADDFDTSTVLNNLTSLITEVSAYVDELSNTLNRENDINDNKKALVTVEPIVAARTLVYEMCDVLGLKFLQLQKSTDDSSNESSNFLSLVEKAVDYRSRIRSIAIKGLKNKDLSVEGKKLLKEILAECDGLRSDMKDQFGIVIDDISADRSIAKKSAD